MTFIETKQSDKSPYTVNDEYSIKVYHVKIKDFYGPEIDVLVTKPREGFPTIEPCLSTYIVEDASEAIGIDKTMEKIAKFYFENYGLCYVKSAKHETQILIDSKDVSTIFKKFRNQIRIF